MLTKIKYCNPKKSLNTLGRLKSVTWTGSWRCLGTCIGHEQETSAWYQMSLLRHPWWQHQLWPSFAPETSHDLGVLLSTVEMKWLGMQDSNCFHPWATSERKWAKKTSTWDDMGRSRGVKSTRVPASSFQTAECEISMRKAVTKSFEQLYSWISLPRITSHLSKNLIAHFWEMFEFLNHYPFVRQWRHGFLFASRILNRAVWKVWTCAERLGQDSLTDWGTQTILHQATPQHLHMPRCLFFFFKEHFQQLQISMHYTFLEPW